MRNDKHSEIMERCWKTIGIRGNASCSLLPKHGHCRHCEQYARVAKSLLDREIPGDELREATVQLAGGKPPLPVTRVSLLIFRIRAEWLAVPTQFLQEVLDPRPIHVVPFRSNKVFTGLVNVNGELLPCFSVADLLQLSTEPADKLPAENSRPSRLVVFEKEGRRFVFPVDEILGVRRLALEGMVHPPSTLGKSPGTFTRGVVELEGKAIGWLEEQKLYSGLEGSLAQ
jgi:chemotaxis-related protein WspD